MEKKELSCPKCGSNEVANPFENQADLLPWELRCMNCFHVFPSYKLSWQSGCVKIYSPVNSNG